MNKPVAYWDGKHFASKDKSNLADIPLYTNPVKVNYEFNSSQLKQLTDEQLIKEVRKRGYKIRNAEIVKELTDDELIELFANHKFSEEGVAKFARAILRKAQEK